MNRGAQLSKILSFDFKFLYDVYMMFLYPSLIPTAILQDLARILQESCKITHHLARSCKNLARVL